MFGCQADAVELQPGFSRKLSAVVLEKKIALFERALKANPQNEVCLCGTSKNWRDHLVLTRLLRAGAASSVPRAVPSQMGAGNVHAWPGNTF